MCVAMEQEFLVSTPAPRKAWDTLIGNCPKSLIYTTPQWMDCVTGVERMVDASRFYEFSNGKQAIVPLIRRTMGCKPLSVLASMPRGWGQGGLIAHPELNKHEVIAILNDLRRLGYMQISIRPNPLDVNLWKGLGGSFDSIIEHSTHILNISGGFGHFWSKTLDSPTRNKIRKGEKSGLVIECDTTGQAIDDFYRIYLRWNDNRARDRKFPVLFYRWLARRREPLEKFRRVSQSFDGNCQIWTAKLNRVPVASAILLTHSIHAFYWRSHSDKALAGPTRANEVLQKYMIEEACKRGCLYYHMGESGGVPSLIHFKEKFGAVRYFYNEYVFENLSLTELRQSFQRLIKRIEEKYIALGKADFI